MVSETWTPIFRQIPADARRALTESLLAAWLDKNLQYPVAQFFTPGAAEERYILPASLGGISGSKVWESAPAIPRGRSKSGNRIPTSEMGNGLHRHGSSIPLLRWTATPRESPEIRRCDRAGSRSGMTQPHYRKFSTSIKFV